MRKKKLYSIFAALFLVILFSMSLLYTGCGPGEIAYTSTVDGALVILIVNFKTTEVTGSVSESGKDYLDATINGKINTDTLEITSNYSGVGRDKDISTGIPINGTITGRIADDLNTLNGVVLSDFLDKGVEFTATRK